MMKAHNALPPGTGPLGRRATIVDVATAAGVSKMTVTRAMNDRPGIKAETRERIKKLAQELDYVPSRYAKGLAQGARTSLGLAVPGLANPYFPTFVSSVVEQATKRGWQVVISDYGDGSMDPVFAVEQLAPQIDAVIGWLGNETGASQKVLGSRPLVLLDLAHAGAAGEVTFDYAYAARLALDHLRDRGRERIAYLDYVRDQGLSVRAQAFARRAGELGIPITFINSEDSAVGARTVISSLIETGQLPDALITFNDVMAIGAIKALAAAGKSVPQDCAVIGMDGIALGELLTPELTTLSIDFKEMGVVAVELVEELLSGQLSPGSEESKRVLKHQLSLRQSS
jgi:DNA-binding LacI/PurR family transcriptional regulator